MAMPTKDALLAAWSTNFVTRVTPTPANFNLQTSQVTQYTTLHDAFIADWAAMNTAGGRSKNLVVQKDTSKAALLQYGREIYAFIQASLTVSAANKELVNIVVRKTNPTPIGIPSSAPDIDVLSVIGRTVRVKLHDGTVTGRSKPPGVYAAAVYSFVGETAPVDPHEWTAEGTITRSRMNVVFDSSLAPGTTVFICAQWMNPRGQTGIASTPTSVTFGSAAMAQ